MTRTESLNVQIKILEKEAGEFAKSGLEKVPSGNYKEDFDLMRQCLNIHQKLTVELSSVEILAKKW